MKLVVKTTRIENEQLVQGCDLDEFTSGFHADWLFDPDYARKTGHDPRFFSDTPPMGIGNSFYTDEPQFCAFLGSSAMVMLNPTETDPERCKMEDGDTCAFLYQNEDGSWTMYEVGYE